VNQTIEDLEDHRQSIIAHIETIEGFLRDEIALIELLREIETELGELEFESESEVTSESI
jgi:hypothetical protein